MKEPIADFSAFLESEESSIISPIKAPKNGPAIIPMGPKNNPTSRPSVDPQTPFFVPPNFFVPSIGMIVSSRVMSNATPSVLHKNVGLFGTTEVPYKHKSPHQPIGGPGSTGRMEPRIPNEIKKKPKMLKKMSIFFDDF